MRPVKNRVNKSKKKIDTLQIEEDSAEVETEDSVETTRLKDLNASPNL